MGNWDRFNKAIDAKALAEQMEEAKANTMQYREVPAGSYDVKVDKLFIKATKDERPMLSAQLRIVDGEFSNSCIFYNRVLYGTKNDGLMIHKANEFIRSFGFDEEDVKFIDYDQYEELVDDLAPEIIGEEFEVEYNPDEFDSIIVVAEL